jgi:hypothetical protein
MGKPLYCDIETRDVGLGDWLNKYGLTGDAAEIGCAWGGFARLVLKTWKGQKYIMVDPWIEQPKDIYKEKTDGVDFEQYWRDCRKLSEEDNRVVLIRKFSVAGAKDVPNDSLCFVHIDGNHSYESVIQDMDAWWPKLKSGGLFSGDDYGNDRTYPNFCEVKSAVDRWMAEHKLTFVVCRRPAWWCIKP